MEINFKANLVNKTFIRKIHPETQKTMPELVSFVEFNHKVKSDIKTLKKVARTWKGSLYANNIYKYAKSQSKKRTFAITKQNSNYEKLNYEDILSLCQISKENTQQYCIEHLETKPGYQQENRDREYKRIGSRTLHSLKKAFYDKTISVNYLYTRIEFYMKNGFDFEDSIYGDLIWKAPNKK